MAQGDGEDEAARAFEGLRAELSMMRRVVERLEAERAEQPEAVDYSEMLGVISQNLSATAQRVDALVHSPALSLTPEETSRQIGAASFDARREDHRLFLAAKQEMEEMTARLDRQLQSHVMAREQRRRLWRVGFAGVALGMAAWAAFAGPIARAVPASWQWPEDRAARALNRSMWDSARRLAGVSQPEAWNAMVAGAVIGQGNQAALDKCQKAAAKAGAPVRCTVRIGTAR